MDKPKVFIDGREGTTGLQLWERLSRRTDLELLRIGEARRKDPAERKKYLNAADLVFLWPFLRSFLWLSSPDHS